MPGLTLAAALAVAKAVELVTTTGTPCCCCCCCCCCCRWSCCCFLSVPYCPIKEPSSLKRPVTKGFWTFFKYPEKGGTWMKDLSGNENLSAIKQICRPFKTEDHHLDMSLIQTLFAVDSRKDLVILQWRTLFKGSQN